MAVLVRAARRAHLDYDGFLYVCQKARRKLKLARQAREHKLPHLLPASELKRFLQIIQNCGNVQHEILLKLLFYTMYSAMISSVAFPVPTEAGSLRSAVWLLPTVLPESPQDRVSRLLALRP